MAGRALPAELPVFPVPGAILLPGATLPLIAFEPRYVALIDDALGAGRLFGLVQPNEGGGPPAPGLFPVGCLARITAFGEAGDGRYLITAAGLGRFRITGEAAGRAGYRRVGVDYAGFAADFDGSDASAVPRKHLLGLVRTYFAAIGAAADLSELEKSTDPELATRLAMTCPFSPAEKQLLLEAPTHAERCRIMIAMIQTELLAENSGSVMH